MTDTSPFNVPSNTDAGKPTAASVLNTASGIVAGIAPLLIVGAIISPAAAAGIAGVMQLLKTAAKLAQGIDPTPAELDHADAEREASNARMNAASALALAQAED